MAGFTIQGQQFAEITDASGLGAAFKVPTYLLYIRTYLHINLPTYIYTNIPAYLSTYTHIYLHTYIHTGWVFRWYLGSRL